MHDLFPTVLLGLYLFAAAALLAYGLNCYVMVVLFARRRKAFRKRLEAISRGAAWQVGGADSPVVTTQIPIYNELNVAERVIRAACRMSYPAGRHEVQVLDDSTDETRQVVDRVVSECRAAGGDVQLIRRGIRTGFKAGALAQGLALARGELVAVFDADFVPPEDYLQESVPFFLSDAGVGLVQARWGHLNRSRSLLTRAQSIGIDGHFMVEQAARNWNGLYMNFNGTAGMWRRSAVESAGGWQWDTLTEDLDLSYRVQLAGWKTVFLPDLVVPAEIPEDVEAFKSQQFRWAKGSIQTARKLLPKVAAAPLPWFVKVQAFFHMTHYLVHPLMVLLALLALPVLVSVQLPLPGAVFTPVAVGLAFSLAAPSALYLAGQRAAYPDWGRRMVFLPALVAVGVGIALSNTRAVAEALVGKQSPFIRTPKRGERLIKHYRLRFSPLAAGELLFGLYCAASFGVYLAAGKYLVGPFLGLYAAGFLFVGLLTAAQRLWGR
jgi:cellulose synthase/poly-beta-1,6-N-acetylglucosamine synthase-like glycosyltransferase